MGNSGPSGPSGHDVCRANRNIDRVNCFSGNDFGTVPYNHCMSQADKNYTSCVERANTDHDANKQSQIKSTPYIDTDRGPSGRRCRG